MGYISVSVGKLSPMASLVGFFLGGSPELELLSSSFCKTTHYITQNINKPKNHHCNHLFFCGHLSFTGAGEVQVSPLTSPSMVPVHILTAKAEEAVHAHIQTPLALLESRKVRLIDRKRK